MGLHSTGETSALLNNSSTEKINKSNCDFAPETTGAPCEFAFAQSGVRIVKAQILVEENTSVNVLRKLGFAFVQEKIDIDDGKIWEWERGKG